MEINRFSGEYKWLSNFAPSVITFRYDMYPSVEHAFQAAKCSNLDERDKIRLAPSPGVARRLGRKVAIDPDWNAHRDDLMYAFLFQKFCYPEYREKLLETGEMQIIEGNVWHDQYWGDCVCTKHRDKPGRNMLGEMLMRVRIEVA